MRDIDNPMVTANDATFDNEEDTFNTFPYNQGKPLLQIEQELLDSGEIVDEDDLNRLYPNLIGNGHPSVCLCPSCAPYEYIEYDEVPDSTARDEYDRTYAPHVPSIDFSDEDVSNHPF